MLREVGLGLTHIMRMKLLYPLSNLWARYKGVIHGRHPVSPARCQASRFPQDDHTGVRGRGVGWGWGIIIPMDCSRENVTEAGHGQGHTLVWVSVRFAPEVPDLPAVSDAVPSGRGVHAGSCTSA